MGIFRPQKLDWDDVEGGLGESAAEAIDNFIGEHCYEPKQYDSDEDLPNDLAAFAERWERVYTNRDTMSDKKQTVAVLSLINGAFYNSWAADRIRESLLKSATKPQLLEIITHVACAYCEYVSLRNRVDAAEKEEAGNATGEEEGEEATAGG
jgi:hypothetical protein